MARKNQSRKKTRVSFVAERSRQSGFPRTKAATQRSRYSRAYRPHMLIFTKLREKSAKKSRISELNASSAFGVSRSKISKRTVKSSKASGSTDYLTIGLTDLATKLFGADAIERMKNFVPESNSEGESNSEESTSQNSVRKIWELTSPTVQCNNVIGKYDASTVCWICGLRIEKEASGMTGECEHILPIAQAVIFLKLYNTNLKGQVQTESEKKMLDLEYSWAHRLCNQEKSDTCPLQMVSVNGVEHVQIFEPGVNKMLKKIWESTRSYAGELVGKLKGKFDDLGDFKDKRAREINERYGSIVNYINERRIEGVKVPGWAALTVLSGLACATTQEFTRPEFHSILSPEAVAEAKQGFDERIQADIRRELGLDALDRVDGLASMLGVYENLGAKIKAFLYKIRSIFQSSRYRELSIVLDLPPNYEKNIDLIVDRIQTDSFKFVLSIYPTIYTHFGNADVTYNFIGNFLVYKFIENIRDTASESMADKPRRFLKELAKQIIEGKKELEQQYSGYLEILNEQYSKFHDQSAAESLIELYQIANAAGVLVRGD